MTLAGPSRGQFSGRLPKTVLVVEDDPGTLESLSHRLEADAIRVVTASTAAEALARARMRDIDFIVLDLRLPDRQGLEVIRSLASDRLRSC